MRILISILFLVLGSMAPSFAAEVLVETRVSAVQLHPDGMRVFRNFELDLPAGRHRIEFRDVMLDLEQFGSLQFDFGDGEFRISGISFASNQETVLTAFESPEKKAAFQSFQQAQKALWALNNRRAGLEAQSKAASAQIAYLDSLSGNSSLENQADSPTAAQISANSKVIGQEYLAALQIVQQAQAKIEEMRFDLQMASERVGRTSSIVEAFFDPWRPDIALYLDVELAKPYLGQAVVSILSPEAGWSAIYEMRLTQDGASGTAVLLRRAQILNASYSAWNGVSGTLSTAEIFVQTGVRDPRTQIGKVFRKPEPESSRSSDQRSQGVVSAPVMEAAVIVEDWAAAGGLWEPGVSPTLKGQVLEFAVSDKLNMPVRSGGIVNLDHLNLDVSLSAKIVPSKRETAFLIARLRNTTNGPILPGSVYIYRDDTYIGVGEIPGVGIGGEFELSFGEFDGIEVSRDLVERFDSDVGIISSTNRRVLRYRTTISSHLDFDLPVRMLDNAPVSEEKDLEIKVLARPQPSERDVDGKRGVVVWEFDLPAGGVERIDFGYEAEWPPTMEFVIR